MHIFDGFRFGIGRVFCSSKCTLSDFGVEGLKIVSVDIYRVFVSVGGVWLIVVVLVYMVVFEVLFSVSVSWLEIYSGLLDILLIDIV